MARSAARRVALFRPLARSLTKAERARVASALGDLLRWQRSLGRWPKIAWAPDATPFVSIYARGVLRGCFGADEGMPGERLARAFLKALEDSRYGGVRAEEREALVAQVSYVIEARPLDLAGFDGIEVGAEGIGIARDGAPVVLLPQVARDSGRAPRALVEMLARKAGLAAIEAAHRPFAFKTEDVVARQVAGRGAAPPSDPLDAAYGWLARLVAREGTIAFAIDARTGARVATGAMHHGRAAVVVQALASRPGAEGPVARARRWLAREVASALAGRPVVGWPTDPAQVAGTLALASMAGVDVTAPLTAAAHFPELRRSPWHAAQVVTAMGATAPEALWRSCVADLDVRSWAPWTTLAARARGDADVLARASAALVDSVRRHAPHTGGAGPADVPEIALTSIVVEALAGARDARTRRAVDRARAFLHRWQLMGDRIPASLDRAAAHGAFPASPIVAGLRCDVTAHAVLALTR